MTVYKWHSGLTKRAWKHKLSVISTTNSAADKVFNLVSFGPLYFLRYLGPHYYREFNTKGTVLLDRDRVISFGLIKTTKNGVVLMGIVIIDYIVRSLLCLLPLLLLSYYHGVLVGVSVFLLAYSVIVLIDILEGETKRILSILKSLMT